MTRRTLFNTIATLLRLTVAPKHAKSIRPSLIEKALRDATLWAKNNGKTLIAGSIADYKKRALPLKTILWLDPRLPENRFILFGDKQGRG